MNDTHKYLTEREQARIVFLQNEIKMLSKSIRRTAARRTQLRGEIRKLEGQIKP